MKRLAWLGDLPPTLSTEEVAGMFGCGVDHLWRLAREGSAPVEPLRLGRKLRWPTAKVLASLGLDPETGEAVAPIVPIRDERAG